MYIVKFNRCHAICIDFRQMYLLRPLKGESNKGFVTDVVLNKNQQFILNVL